MAATAASDDIYAGFAAIYDRLMSGVDYEAWTDYVVLLLQRFHKNPSLLIDLACGSGSSTLPFAARGYCIEGMDRSAAMLRVARFKAEQKNLPVHFFQGDLRSYAPRQRHNLALLFQDGLNYLLSENDLAASFNCIYRNLEPGALFIFDLTRLPLRGGEEKKTLCWADDQEMTLIWESAYRPAEAVWEVELTAFYREGDSTLYRKLQERHLEKDYEPEQVRRLLAAAGFSLLGLYPTFHLEPARGHEPKLTFVAEKQSP